MKVYRSIYTSLLTALLIGWGCVLTGCTDHPEIEQSYTDESVGEPLRVVGMTRSGDETDVPDPMKGQSVQLFLDDGKSNPIPSDAVTYNGKTANSDDLFGNTTTLKVKPGEDYHVFGFLPSNANALTEETNGNSSVTVNSETQTATMTIENLASLSTKDVCVVIGVKGKLKEEDEKVVAGSFKYHAPEDTEEGFGVSLLVDHLFAAIEFNMCVGATYNAIRTIKLKKVVMRSTNAKKVTAVITLTMNDEGTNLMNVDFTPTETAQEETTLYESEDENGTALDVNTPIEFRGFYSASLGSTLSIESTYDICDKDGNKIDENRKSVNNLSKVLSNIARGKKVQLNLTVIPTYLYILSDNDPNNPTIVVGGN